MTLERGSYERCGTERTRSSRLGPGSPTRIGQVRLETRCRNLDSFVGILPPSRISNTDAVKVAEVTEVCATSVTLAKSIVDILRSTSWVCDRNATSYYVIFDRAADFQNAND